MPIAPIESEKLVFWVEDTHGLKLALFIKSSIAVSGLKFFTDDSSTFQLGAMTRPTGEYIQAHVHEHVQRAITGTHEVLLLQSGRIRVDLFARDREYVESVNMEAGDVVLLCEGGHGIEILDEARLIEVKQGPFAEGKDKTKFDHILPSVLKLANEK